MLTGLTNIVASQTNSVNATVTYPSVFATDSGSGVLSVISSPASGSSFPVGITTVNVTATDVAGNTATGQFTVTVDDTPPVVNHYGNVTLSLAADSSNHLSALLDTVPPVSFVDPRQDAVETVQVDFGDGTGLHTIAMGSNFRTVELTNVYTKEGNYLVSVQVTDQFGATSIPSTFQVIVLPPVDLGTVAQGSVPVGNNQVTVSAKDVTGTQQVISGTLTVATAPGLGSDPNNLPTLLLAPASAASNSPTISVGTGSSSSPTVDTKYEVRLVDPNAATDGVGVSITFHYQVGDDPSAPPVVQYFDPILQKNVIVDPSIYTFNTADHTVTLTFGSGKGQLSPSILTHLIFTISVSAQPPTTVVTTTLSPTLAEATNISLALSQRSGSDAGSGQRATIQFRSSLEDTVSLATTTSGQATGNRVASGAGDDSPLDDDEPGADGKRDPKKTDERKEGRSTPERTDPKPANSTQGRSADPATPRKTSDEEPEARRLNPNEVIDAVFARVGIDVDFLFPALLDVSNVAPNEMSTNPAEADGSAALLCAAFLLPGLAFAPDSSRRWHRRPTADDRRELAC